LEYAGHVRLLRKIGTSIAYFDSIFQSLFFGETMPIASSVPQIVRDSNRFRQVITILAKYGLARWLSNSSIPWMNKLLRDAEGHEIGKLTFDESVRCAITELGTTFIKLGQILSTRADLIGVDLAAELSQLRANVPPESIDSIIATIEQELGKNVNDLFADFQRAPVAAASIAQVHRATMHDGTVVAVKVQRKDIEKHILTDLDILLRVAELAENHSRSLRHYQPVSTANKFRATLLRELDFRREQQNMLQFIRNFANDERVKFARPIEELTTARVLTMEFLSGTPVSAVATLKQQGLDASELANLGAGVFLDMIFRDGFYHADPHPGNILILDDGRIGLLDCGMVGRIEEGLRDQIENLLLSIAAGDSHQLTRTVVFLGSIPPDFEEMELENDIAEYVAEYTRIPLSELDLSHALREMIELVRRHKITLPASITLLLKVLVMLDGTSKIHDPDFSLAALIAPYRFQALKRRYSPSRLLRSMEENMRDWHEFLRILPANMGDILDRVKRGKFDVHLEHRRLDSIINRLVSGVLTAALFTGSSALWSRQVPPLLFDTSIPGFLGCAISIWLGLTIFRAIRRSGKIDDSY
jgi:ubiquinone biosynthesis protein